PVGDHQTTFATVALGGQTDPNTPVVLLESGATMTADGTGAFTFTGVALALGANPFTVRATDVAGNSSEFATTITRLQGDVTPPEITAALTHDTGANATDGLTFDPALAGTVTDTSP